jgi:predicted nucleotidyltransferase
METRDSAPHIEALISEAGQRLVAAASTPARVFVFGSRARGDAHAQSDFDFLVIEQAVGNRIEEMARLLEALEPLELWPDVLVVDAAHVEEWADVPGTLVHAALREGRLIAEA